jgi:HAD superfamily hydrolase (TIGR01509 family)
MALRVGVKPPVTEVECIALAIEASTYVTERVHSAYPGAIETLHDLKAHGYVLHTASNQMSHELDGYLRGMGVRGLFPERVYGQDLAGVGKGHRLFYDRIFHETGIDPSEALVLDDSPMALSCAKAAGAETVLVARDVPNGYEGSRIATLSDIWSILFD